MNIVLINLLPHREAKRKKRREAFYAGVVLSLVAGLILLGLGYTVLSEMISAQQSRNNFLTAQIAKLDVQIKDIATLRQQIESLRARQQAVENLQSDRNLSVYLFDDLTQDTPPGVQLTSIKQEGQSVLIQGTALSQERVADLLRNLADSKGWLEKPELIEIHSVTQHVGKDNTQTESAFQLRATLKRAAAPADGASGAARTGNSNPAG
ncbi:MAG: fimbrial assembly protein [Proteobacteria bacterium]|nr:fimbrial assembly protein [Pseudomonadota bacterium]